MEALDRVGLEHGAGAARLEQPVHRLDAESAEEGLVPAIASPIELGERLAARGLVDDLADVLLVDRARGVHLGRGFGQPHLQRNGLGGSSRSRRASETRREPVQSPSPARFGSRARCAGTKTSVITMSLLPVPRMPAANHVSTIS